MRCYFVVATVFCLSIVDATKIPEFIHKRKAWEGGYAAVVDSYSDSVLKSHFIDLRANRSASVPAHIDSALVEIISFPTGRELIADIVVSLEPRIKFLKSIQNVIEVMD